MTTRTNTTGATDEHHARLMREAERQGVRPLSFDELLGDPVAGDPEKEDVEEFVRSRREQREFEQSRSRG